MWIITNGAHKTGSTWVNRLLRSTGRLETVPEQFQNKTWANPSVTNEEIDKAARLLGPSDTIYGSKQHFSHASGILDIYGVKVINSIRDIRDTAVSRYFHDVRTHGETADIETYFYANAEKVVSQFIDYQRYWIDAPEKHAWNYHVTSYEYLSANTVDACREMFLFCGFFMGQDTIEKIVDKADFDKLDTGPGKFFRKGKVHAFADDLSPALVDRIMDLAEKGGLRDIKRRIAAFNPSLTPYLETTDVGL